MIQSDRYKQFQVFCDYCDETELFDTGGNWQVLINTVKEYGWKIKKVNDDWFHKCPTCTASVCKEAREW